RSPAPEHLLAQHLSHRRLRQGDKEPNDPQRELLRPGAQVHLPLTHLPPPFSFFFFLSSSFILHPSSFFYVLRQQRERLALLRAARLLHRGRQPPELRLDLPRRQQPHPRRQDRRLQHRVLGPVEPEEVPAPPGVDDLRREGGPLPRLV